MKCLNQLYEILLHISQNSRQILGPSYKVDLDVRDKFWKEKHSLRIPRNMTSPPSGQSATGFLPFTEKMKIHHLIFCRVEILLYVYEIHVSKCKFNAADKKG